MEIPVVDVGGVPPNLIQLIKIDVANPGFVIASMLRYICMCVFLAPDSHHITRPGWFPNVVLRESSGIET